MHLEDTADIFHHVAFDVLVMAQVAPDRVTRPVIGSYRRGIRSSLFSVLPTEMRYQDLGLLAAQLLLWEEFFGCFVECDMQFFRKQPDGQSWRIGTGSLRNN